MSSDLKYWYLHDHKLFRNLSFSEIDALCILKKFKRGKKNEYIELPHSNKERIYFLKQGAVKLMRIDEQGDEVLLDLLQKGDLFGDLNLEKASQNQDFFKVVSNEAIICTFLREKLEEVMFKKPDFALNYIKFIGFNFKRIQNSYKNILFKDARTRLLLLLNLIIEKENHEGNDEFVLPCYITQKDLGQLICTTRQTIISLIKTLKNEGVLDDSQKVITIPSIKKVKDLIADVK